MKNDYKEKIEDILRKQTASFDVVSTSLLAIMCDFAEEIIGEEERLETGGIEHGDAAETRIRNSLRQEQRQRIEEMRKDV